MISENIKQIRKRILSKCLEVGRNPSEITLVAVSKNFGVEDILSAFSNGLNNFGENKAQELKHKHESIGNKVVWHFIGHLQTNKVKYVVRAADYIHSVDSLRLAEEINIFCEKYKKKMKCLLEIKTSDEDAKYGLKDFAEIEEVSRFCFQSSNIELMGLMTMAPFTDDESRIRNSFRKLKNFQTQLNNKNLGLKELSMGMTSDFEIAIEEGATILRIGTAIFGERNYI
jgi:hypothetical protein